MINKHCSWCDKQFQTKLSYQIYCSTECREQATKEKIAEKYLRDKVKKRIGKIRLCKSCNKYLSIYTEESICNACLVNPDDIKNVLKDIREIMDGKTKLD